MPEIDRAGIVIIGGGVVGCAIFRKLALAGLKPLLLEAGRDILSGASKGNSAILHTGFDAPANSLELACMQTGYREYRTIHHRLNLPLMETGALVVAWNEEQQARLPGIVAHARANNVGDVALVSVAELRRREPRLASHAQGAVFVPGEHIIDPWSAPLAYALQGIAHGGRIRRDCKVLGGMRTANGWSFETLRGRIAADIVVNAAGNHGDEIETICRPSPFAITPRKGQFVVFDKPAAKLVKSIILPVPTERTKGIVICRTAFGNLLVGPTAEDQQNRDRADVDETTLKMLVAKGAELLPALSAVGVNAIYAGLRPATEHKDYQISVQPEQGWITVGGIRSTGLTGSLGIASHVAGLFSRHFRPIEDAAPIWTPVPNLCEERPRPYLSGEGSEILCHCEWVTRGEIEAALGGPLPAGDVGGLKRRTRAMMGRCQGFYCSAQVMALAEGKLEP
jgi:glycerol-3-phosphate dehydrogenase